MKIPIILFPSRCWKRQGRPSKAFLRARQKAMMYTLEYSAPSSASPWTEDRNSIDDAEIVEQMSIYIPSTSLFLCNIHPLGSQSHSLGRVVGLNSELVLSFGPEQDWHCRCWRSLRFLEAATVRIATFRGRRKPLTDGDGFAEGWLSQLWRFRISIIAQVINISNIVFYTIIVSAIDLFIISLEALLVR